MNKIYLYGMIMSTQSFLLHDKFPEPDGYAEIKQRRHLLGGETGTAAAILSSLGCELVLGGTHLGRLNNKLIRDYFNGKMVDLSRMVYNDTYDGVIDFVMIDKDTRTVFGEFGGFFSRKDKWFEAPSEDAIKECNIVGTDPFFGDAIIPICRRNGKKYATIDSNFDSDMNKYCEINAVSHQHLKYNMGGCKDYRELLKLYTDNTDGLVIFTFGENEVMYGRKGQEAKYFKPYDVDVVSTLGAGDSFKAGTIYALNEGMNDDDIVRFACATAGCACANFPIALNPPTLEKVNAIIASR